MILRFPDSIACISAEGYSEKSEKIIKGFGGKTIAQYPTVKLRAIAETEEEIQQFNYWYYVDCNSGENNFVIDIPFAGVSKEWSARIISSVDSTLAGNSKNLRYFDFEIEILDDVSNALDYEIDNQIGEYIL